ncbi:MAG TPA: hypothetical protein VFU21_05190 [Kofleriaceae bacterium]|nr:hypothetical protein [Kofleriaceae bacterium]
MRPQRIARATLTSLAFAAALTAAPETRAEPRSTVWLEDLNLRPPAATEASLFYEFQAADAKAMDQGIDLLTLRLAAGVSERLELAPMLRFRQRGSEEFRLHDLGGMLRARIAGSAAAPRLVAYGAYFNDLGTERDHRFVAGAAGRYDAGRWFVAADLRGSAYAGGELADTRELWIGGAVGRAFLAERQLTAGLETFLIAPFGGARMSDPTFGESAESSSFYYGPNVTFRAGPFWTAASAASGFGVSEPASQILFRWMVGIQN